MTIPFYTWLHLAGIALLLLATGGLTQDREGTSRKLLTAAHGAGLILALVGGFGLLARYEIHWPWPTWVFVKVGIWFVFGSSLTLIKKLPNLRTPIWWGAWVLFLVAAYLGLNHSI